MDPACFTFREQALTWMTAAFGAPMAVRMGNGALVHRWILPRARGRSIHITLNSPGVAGAANLLVSDPRRRADPVASITLRSLADLDREIARILQRWNEARETRR
jgi:hypothetical protein